MDLIRNIEAAHLKKEIPEFGPGDTVRISVRVVEGEKTRSQVFQGVVIARSGPGTRESIVLRKISDGVAVERIFPLHSPNLQTIEVVRRGKVRRARLTYLRGRKGKSARIREGARLQARQAAVEADMAAGQEPGARDPESEDAAPDGEEKAQE